MEKQHFLVSLAAFQSFDLLFPQNGLKRGTVALNTRSSL
jgi:hypothetical protein